MTSLSSYKDSSSVFGAYRISDRGDYDMPGHATQPNADEKDWEADIYSSSSCAICHVTPSVSLLLLLVSLIRPSSPSCSLSPPLVARPSQRTRSWSGCLGSTTVTSSCTSGLPGEFAPPNFDPYPGDKPVMSNASEMSPFY